MKTLILIILASIAVLLTSIWVSASESSKQPTKPKRIEQIEKTYSIQFKEIEVIGGTTFWLFMAGAIPNQTTDVWPILVKKEATNAEVEASLMEAIAISGWYEGIIKAKFHPEFH